MSTNELRVGRRPIQLVWPDDRVTTVGEGGCKSLTMIEVRGDMSMVPMIRAEFDDGSNAVINPWWVAMILFGDDN